MQPIRRGSTTLARASEVVGRASVTHRRLVGRVRWGSEPHRRPIAPKSPAAGMLVRASGLKEYLTIPRQGEQAPICINNRVSSGIQQRWLIFLLRKSDKYLAMYVNNANITSYLCLKYFITMDANVIVDLLTEEEKATITKAFKDVKAIVDAKLPDLNPEKRRYFGSINEQNKLFVNKAREVKIINPQLAPLEVDWVEYEKDYSARMFYEGILLMGYDVIKRMESAKMMHDYDNYNDSLVFYRYLDFKRRSDTPGAEASYNALREFFTRARNTSNQPKK